MSYLEKIDKTRLPQHIAIIMGERAEYGTYLRS